MQESKAPAPGLDSSSGGGEAPGARRRGRIRVLLAKPGLDGHDRGIKVILRALADAGMEVIYTGMRVPPEGVVLAALQEAVDAVGLSNHSGAHRELFEAVARGLQRQGLGPDQLVLFCGGAVPPEDVPYLRELGFRGIFPPGTRLDEIVDFLHRETGAIREAAKP